MNDIGNLHRKAKGLHLINFFLLYLEKEENPRHGNRDLQEKIQMLAYGYSSQYAIRQTSNMKKTVKAVESVLNKYNTEVYLSVSPEKKCTVEYILTRVISVLAQFLP